MRMLCEAICIYIFVLFWEHWKKPSKHLITILQRHTTIAHKKKLFMIFFSLITIGWLNFFNANMDLYNQIYKKYGDKIISWVAQYDCLLTKKILIFLQYIRESHKINLDIKILTIRSHINPYNKTMFWGLKLLQNTLV